MRYNTAKIQCPVYKIRQIFRFIDFEKFFATIIQSFVLRSQSVVEMTSNSTKKAKEGRNLEKFNSLITCARSL